MHLFASYKKTLSVCVVWQRTGALTCLRKLLGKKMLAPKKEMLLKSRKHGGDKKVSAFFGLFF